MQVYISLCLISVLIISVLPAYPPGLRQALPLVANLVTDANYTCDSSYLNVTLTMRHPFKGLLFAKDFAQECKSIGTFSNTVGINLPTSGCGVRLSSLPDNSGNIEMFFWVHLIIQQDRFLRQITDQEKIVRCPISEDAFMVKSRALANILNTELEGGKISHRVGRMKDAGWSKELEGKQLEDELDEALSASRAWMEIVPDQNTGRSSGTLQVGETATLTVKSTLPAGIGWTVVDCVAHDGLGDASQQLLDSLGCPLDAFLMPSLTYGPARPIALMRHQEAVSSFAAFKFPDRDRLHLACGLQLCKGMCPKVDCDYDIMENRTAKALFESSQAEILDRLEVFNSIEVLAPEIDDPRQSDRLSISGDALTYPFTNIPGDRTFCVSPDKMAIAFCILGLIFLTAVIVAACSLLRTRKQNPCSSTYYTRSLFSSSSSSSGFGSKLLLHESPCLGQPSTSRMQYGRIL